MFDDEVRLLRGLERFRSVDMGSLKLMAMAGRRVRLEPGEILMRQGDEANAVHIIMEGEAVMTRQHDGMTTELVVMKPGAIVGEVSVVLQERLFATLTARTPLTSLRFDGAVYLDLVQQVPALAMAAIRDLAEMLRLATVAYTQFKARVPAEI